MGAWLFILISANDKTVNETKLSRAELVSVYMELKKKAVDSSGKSNQRNVGKMLFGQVNIDC